MGTVPYFIYLIGFLALVQLITMGILVKVFLGIRFKYAKCRLCEPEEIPDYLNEVFSPCVQELADLGFEVFHYQLSQEPIDSPYAQKWNVVLVNPDLSVYAALSTSSLPDKNMPVKVEFTTFFSDGVKLVSINGSAHEIIGTIPDHILVDVYAESIEKQFQAHMDKLASLKDTKFPQLVTPSHYVNEETKTIERYVDSLYSRRILKSKDDQTYQFCFIPALKHAFKVMIGKNKSKAMQNKRKKLLSSQNITPPDLPVELEIEAFHKQQYLQRPKPGGQLGKFAVFIISMLLFMVSFKVAFSLQTVFIFVVVIFIHEMGHMLGMYLFRYKDVQVMFLPFLGAATIGSNKNTTAFRQVIVYLLGPWPGIVLGTICLALNFVYPSEILFDFGTFMLVLNYLNLIPILPLDGGRVFELILFSRARILRTIFLFCSILLLALGGLALHSPIMLIIPVFLLISLPLQMMHHRSHTILMKKIREENLDLEDNTLVPAIFSILREKPFSKMPFEHKYQTAKTLLNNAFKKPPTIGISILSFFIYILVWITPLFVGFAAGIVLAFVGSTSNYDTGIISYYIFPDSDKVCVTNASGLLSNYSIVLDKDGQMLTNLGKNSTFLSPDSIWRPGGDCVLFENTKRGHLFARETTQPSPLMLKNVVSNQNIEIVRPETEENCYYEYSGWNPDGTCLCGLKTTYSNDYMNHEQALFLHHIDTGKIEEIPLQSENSYPTFTANGYVILSTYDDEEYDQAPQGFSIYNISTGQTTDYTLPEDTQSWQVTGDATAVIAIQKQFADNKVTFQVIEINLTDGNQTVLLDSSKLPSHTFEDAARGKQSWCTLQLSPSGKWGICDAFDHTQKTTKWLINRSNENCCKFVEYDSNEKFPSNISYSADENLICFRWSSMDFLDSDEDMANDSIEIYDISKDLPSMVQAFECEENCFNYQFFGDHQLLYIKEDADDNPLRNQNELWALRIEDGTKRKFIQREN